MTLTFAHLAREAFGIAMPWDESKRPMARAEGHTFSTSEALGIVSNEVFLRLLTPKVCPSPSCRLPFSLEAE